VLRRPRLPPADLGGPGSGSGWILQFRQLLVSQAPLVPIGTFGNVAHPVALLLDVVEHLSQFAPAPPGGVPVDAHVKVLTVVGVGVPRVGRGRALVYLGTFEVENL
jgi:hypothetical protein